MSRGPSREAGFSLVSLMAVATIALILMAAAAPSWKYVAKDDREQELISRGMQIARAIERYQKENGNTYPTSLDILVKKHYLRKAYKDPMTKSGKWKINPTLTGVPGGGPAGLPGASPSPTASPSSGFGRSSGFGGSSPSPGGLGVTSTGVAGLGSIGNESLGGPAIQSIASASTEKSLRIFNGQERYDKWVFTPNMQEPTIGKTLVPGQPNAAPAVPPSTRANAH